MKKFSFLETDRLIYNPNWMDPTLPTGLWFCANAVEAEVVSINAVSLSTLGDWEDLNSCQAFISQFPYVLVAIADDRQRAIAVKELRDRVLCVPILIPAAEAFRGCKTLNDLKELGGEAALERLLLGAIEQPARGLLNLADVQQPNLSDMPRVTSGFQYFDRALGGFHLGELSVWTGRRGEGKSTLLGQLLLESINQGHKVCAYSGELPAWRFKNWISLQAAGPNHIEKKNDRNTGKTFYTVGEPVQRLIDEWMNRYFWLYDLGVGNAHDEDSIMQVFEYAVRCYGCDIFLVDNLMTARFKTVRDADFYRAQSAFTGCLVEFAKKCNVHIHLVAHPRKTDNKRLESDDVGGSGDVTNRGDNVFCIQRLDQKEADEKGCQTKLSILKNRGYGASGIIGLNFDEPSRRFYTSGGNPNRCYSWELMEQKSFSTYGLPPKEDPFRRTV